MQTMRLEEAAKYLNISADSLRDLAAIGEVPATRLGKNSSGAGNGLPWIFVDVLLDHYLLEKSVRDTNSLRTKHGIGKLKFNDEEAATPTRIPSRRQPRVPPELKAV